MVVEVDRRVVVIITREEEVNMAKGETAQLLDYRLLSGRIWGNAPNEDVVGVKREGGNDRM